MVNKENYFYTFFNEYNPFFTATDSWYAYIFKIITECFFKIWEYRFAAVIQIISLTVICMLLYFLWQTIKHHTNKTNTFTPPTYNTQMSINLWLHDINEYIENSKINNEQDKREIILKNLDKTSRNLIQKMINDKKIKSYNDLESTLKNYFGNNNLTQSDDIYAFITRKQASNETLAQFHKVMESLVLEAYPNTPKTTQDAYLAQYFIKGLNNQALKHELVLTKSTNTEDVLSNAIELQAKLAKLNDNQDIYAQHLFHVQTQSNQVQSIPTTLQQPQHNQHSQHHNTYYQQPIFHSQAQEYTMQSQQQINNQQREPRYNNNNRFNNYNPYISEESKQNRREFNRNRNNNQTNYSSNYQNYNNNGQFTTRQNPINAPIVCYKCNTVGHYSSNCQNPTNRNQPRIYPNQINNQIQQQQPPSQLNNQINNNQTQQQQPNSQLNHQTNDNQTLKPGAQAFIPININQRSEKQSRDASPNNRSISPNHSTFNFHQQTQN